MTDQNVVRMMGNNSSVRDQESLVKHRAIVMRAYGQADNSTFGHDKKVRTPWFQTDGKRRPSKREASIGRRQNRNDTIGGKEADAASFDTAYVVKYSGKTR